MSFSLYLLVTNMTFSLYLLAAHPEIQRRCQVELNTIFWEDRDRPATSQDINKMKYLELCLKESLRWWQDQTEQCWCLLF